MRNSWAIFAMEKSRNLVVAGRTAGLISLLWRGCAWGSTKRQIETVARWRKSSLVVAKLIARQLVTLCSTHSEILHPQD
jgi:hypothetical protein